MPKELCPLYCKTKQILFFVLFGDQRETSKAKAVSNGGELGDVEVASSKLDKGDIGGNERKIDKGSSDIAAAVQRRQTWRLG